MAKNTRIMEIGGVKLEVDMRYCKTVEHFTVGQNVKVLKKEYSNYEVYAGIIVGFDNFAKLPTITVACLKPSSYDADIMLININAETTDIELVPMITEEVLFDKKNIVAKLDRQVAQKERELEDITLKRRFFIDRYGKTFETLHPKFLETQDEV
jgi:hypothetical protein